MSQRQKLGLWMATSLVIGNVVGSGIFLLPTSLAHYGSLSLVSWGVTGVGAIFLALVFARLSRRHPQQGGLYVFSRLAFGDFIGFQVAWGYWLGTWISTAALLVTAVSYLSVFFPILAQDPRIGTSVAIGILWIFTLFQTFGVRQVGMLQVLSTVLKLVPIIIVGGIGWFFISGAHFVPFNPSGEPPLQALSGSIILTLFAFIGIESATVPAKDVKNPGHTIPRATIIGTVTCAVLYILSTGAVLGLVPREVLGNSHAPFVDALQHMVGPAYGVYAKFFVVISAVISCLGALNGYLLLQAHMPYAAARDGLFPSAFKTLSKRNVPIFGLILSSVALTVFLLMNAAASLVEQFNFIILISTFSILMPYAFSSVAEVVLLLKKDKSIIPQEKNKDKKNLALAVFLGAGAFIFSFWAIAGSGEKVVFMGALSLMGSVPVYIWVRWQNRSPTRKIKS